MGTYNFAFFYKLVCCFDNLYNCYLSFDVASGSEITSCNKIDKPRVVYRFFGKRYDVHYNVAYIMTKL